MSTRVTLGAVGVAVGLYGAWLLVSRQSIDQLVSTAVWLAGGVLVHDALIAPIVLVVGMVVVRVAPVWSRGSLAVGALVLGTLTAAAIPVLGAWGRRADNPTLLDRDYTAGWFVVAGLVALGVLLGSLVVRSRTKGADDGARAGGR